MIIAEPGRESEAATRLGRIGFDNVAGYLSGGMQRARRRARPVEPNRADHGADARRAARRGEPPLVLDVAHRGEVEAGHIDRQPQRSALPPARSVSTRFPRDRPLVVHCASGYRSSIAASLLERHGRPDVTDLVGGMGAWEASRLA